MCEAKSRLNETFQLEGIRRANCNAHQHRALRDAETVQPVLRRGCGES